MPVRHIWVDEIVTRRVPVLKWQTDEGVLFATEHAALVTQLAKARKASAAFSNTVTDEINYVLAKARVAKYQNLDFNLWRILTSEPEEVKKIADRAVAVKENLQAAEKELADYDKRLLLATRVSSPPRSESNEKPCR